MVSRDPDGVRVWCPGILTVSVFGIQGSCGCRCLVFRDPDVFGVHVLMVSVFGVMLGPCLVSRDPDGVRVWCQGS